MDINQILQTLDHLFATGQTDKVEGFLIGELAKALSLDDHSTAITIMNELIGFYRSISRMEDSMMITEKALSIIHHVGLSHTIGYATTLLNGATAYRAAGNLQVAEQYYTEALALYTELLPTNDYRFAGLYNNMSTLFGEQKQFDQAIVCLTKALHILRSIEQDSMEEAVTHTNLSLLYFEQKEEALCESHIEEALRIFATKEGTQDAHYSGALAGLAQIYYKQKKYKEAMETYEKALAELKKNFGENSSYALLCENYALVCETIGDQEKANVLLEKAFAVSVSLGIKTRTPLSGLELAKQYYETYGKPMIAHKFPEYAHRIAVGLVGQGSECFGFDDLLSTDHDFGPSFCLWLTDEDYDKIGVHLQEAYEQLPDCFAGYAARNTTNRGAGRVGVMKISSFYEEFIGTSSTALSNEQWLSLPEHLLATATNGEVFYDPLGEFTRIRTFLLAFYPEDVRIKKIAARAAIMAQSGQYNYSRCMMRGDLVAANFALQEFIRSGISMVHLLNRSYTPYYKWMHKNISRLPILSEVAPLLQELSSLGSQHSAWEAISAKAMVLNLEDAKVALIEQITSMIIKELQKQDLSDETSDFLEDHTNRIMSHIIDDTIKTKHIMEG